MTPDTTSDSGLKIVDDPHRASAPLPGLPASEALTPPSDFPPALPIGRALRAVFAGGTLFALAGLLVGLRVVAQATLPHILQPGEYVNFQEVWDGLPVPRLLAWNPDRIDFLISLRDLSGFSFALACLAVFGPLWLLAVRRVNLTFRLFGTPAAVPEPMSIPQAAPEAENVPTADEIGGDDEVQNEEAQISANHTAASSHNDTPLSSGDSTPETVFTPESTAAGGRFAPAATLAKPLEFYGLIKAGTLLAALGLPLAAVWILVDFEDKRNQNAEAMVASSGPLIGNVWALRLVLLGLAFWMGFHRNGIAGDFADPEWNRFSKRTVGLALRGALFGLLAFGLLRFGLPANLEDALVRLQTLGPFNIALWKWVSTWWLLGFGATGFSIGALFALFTCRLKRPVLLVSAFVPLAALGIAVYAQRPWSPKALAARFDITPAVLKAIPENAAYRPDKPTTGVPDSVPAGRQLAQKLRLSTSPRLPGRTFILFDQNLPILLYQNSYTSDGLAADAASAGLAADFLRQRDYQSALSWVAIKHLYNVPVMQFDTSAAIAVGLQDLTRSPHNEQFGHSLLQMFAVCAASPQNEALLDQWADERQFAFPERDSRRLMGDLYRRFGRADKALQWYRKAEMPASFLKRVQTETVMFHQGRLAGAVRLNGKPLAGAQIAVIPSRMNGLPRGLETPVNAARREILNANPYRASEMFPLWHPQPYSLRWISAAATTDSQGVYHVDNLTEGAYTVLCALPPDAPTRLPQDDRMHIIHPPRAFTVNYKHPFQDAGTTEIEYRR